MSSSQNFVYDKGLTARIRWTEPMELTLAQNADAKEVLYRTKIGAAEKWKQIHSDLTNHYFFARWQVLLPLMPCAKSGSVSKAT